ncbi:substrate-binding domain-containing protein [Nonomuraea sp. NPDC050394]|uniref:substrate-binding domain-containing protein n=1 Tax=Nonomuraea sp. NPDC050394 TaxID=3364363 RepID=UPI0037B53ACC
MRPVGLQIHRCGPVLWNVLHIRIPPSGRGLLAPHSRSTIGHRAGRAPDHGRAEASDGWCAARGRPPLIGQTPFVGSAESRYQAADRLLNDHPELDAVVSAPEGGALGILQAAERRRIRAPGDVLIASCVDHSSLWSAKPPITAIDLNPRLMGRYGAELLADLLEGRAAAPVTRALPTRLVERDSTLPRAPR